MTETPLPKLVQHDHREQVEGCFRCEIAKDEGMTETPAPYEVTAAQPAPGLMAPKRHERHVADLRGNLAEMRAHEHEGSGSGSGDYFCLNIAAFMGERVGTTLDHIDALEAEIRAFRAQVAALTAERDGLRAAVAEALEMSRDTRRTVGTTTATHFRLTALVQVLERAGGER